MSELGRLRWQCRRGMKELDVLLERWLQREGPEASAEVLARFAALLALQDPELARYLLAGEPHADANTHALVVRIRHNA